MGAVPPTISASGPRIKRGSTLMEIAIVIVITGVAITALMEFVVAATRGNRSLNEYYVATILAKSGQEWAATRSEAELLAFFAGQTEKQLTGLLDANGEVAADPAYDGYSHVFSYRKVSSTDPAATDSEGDLYEIRVSVKRGEETLCTLTRLHDLS